MLTLRAFLLCPQDGDDERIDQQLGEVGDNEEVVDEKLWDGNDSDDGDGPEDQNKKKDKYEKDAPIQVSMASCCRAA